MKPKSSVEVQLTYTSKIGQNFAEEEVNLQEKSMAQQGKRWGCCQRAEQGKARLLATRDSRCNQQLRQLLQLQVQAEPRAADEKELVMFAVQQRE